MGEITREGIDTTETDEERKARKKAKKKLKKARKRAKAAEREKLSGGDVVPVRAEVVPRRDPYSYYSHNRSAYQQRVDGWLRICGDTEEDDNFGY